MTFCGDSKILLILSHTERIWKCLLTISCNGGKRGFRVTTKGTLNCLSTSSVASPPNLKPLPKALEEEWS